MTKPWDRRVWLCSALIAAAWSSAGIAEARQISVCAHGCAYRQPADGVAAARDGDTVAVAGGTYAGGFVIDKNVTLRGAGARQTVIQGGGPVITVGVFDAATEPTVTLRDLTVTGGLTRSSGGEPETATGGGIWIPPSTDGGVGANLTIVDSAITGNTAAPAVSVDAGPNHPCSETSDCQFALAGGGGIDTWGNLTVADSVISDNTAAGPVTSDADGGGIYGQQGTLTVQDSVITRNQSIAGPAAGRFAEGAGIMFDTSFSGGCVAPAPACRVVIRDTAVQDNRSALTTSLPAFAQGVLIQPGANAGGVHIGNGIPTTVLNTDVTDNVASADNPTGEGSAIDAAVNVGDSPLTMRDVGISGNRTLTITGSSEDVGPAGSTLELDGPGDLSDVDLERNVSRETSPGGLATAGGALAVFNFSGDPALVSVRDSVISANVTESDSSTGQAVVLGAGVLNNSLLSFERVTVTGNVGRADGQGGVAQGGGIWNGVDLSGPPVELTLSRSAVVGNVLAASPGIDRQGGGLYTTSPVSLNQTLIARNRPDQCVGCSLTAHSMVRRAWLRARIVRR